MIKQFLLNYDGSIPHGTNLTALIEAGIPLVIPSMQWLPKEGYILQEAEPIEVDGKLVQQWEEVSVPITSSIDNLTL